MFTAFVILGCLVTDIVLIVIATLAIIEGFQFNWTKGDIFYMVTTLWGIFLLSSAVCLMVTHCI